MQSQLKCSPRFSRASTSAKYENTTGTAPPILKKKRNNRNKKSVEALDYFEEKHAESNRVLGILTNKSITYLHQRNVD